MRKIDLAEHVSLPTMGLMKITEVCIILLFITRINPLLAEVDLSTGTVIQNYPDEPNDSGVLLKLNPATLRGIQQKLNQLGYDAGHVDGAMGPQTQSALRNFQEATGIEPTGTLDFLTLSALGVELPYFREHRQVHIRCRQSEENSESPFKPPEDLSLYEAIQNLNEKR